MGLNLPIDLSKIVGDSRLPVGEVLPGLLEVVVGRGRNAVLVAPPGAGKTTLVPLALMGVGVALYERFGFVAEGRLKGNIMRAGVMTDSFTMARVKG